MARFDAIQATAAGCTIQLRFEMDSGGVLGWQLFDPSTGAFLYEGEWRETASGLVDVLVTLPAEEGHYRVHVAPVSDRARYIAIDARVDGAKVEMDAPRVVSAASERLRRTLRAIPKAFTLPVRSITANRKLIRSMVERDILARYRGSFAGALWTFLNPLLLMATYSFVFGVVLQSRFPGDATRSGYVLYFLAGMLPWLAFSEAVARAPSVIVEHRTFVKKLRFPLETLPVNLVIAALVTQAFATLVFFAGFAIARGSLPSSAVWLPVLLIPQVLFTAGLCWALAATGVFVRDLGQVIGFLLTLWFFLTPICYPEDAIPAPAAQILGLNPVLVLVRGYRAILLENRAPLSEGLLYLWIGSAVMAILGYAWFHRLRKSFADVI